LLGSIIQAFVLESGGGRDENYFLSKKFTSLSLMCIWNDFSAVNREEIHKK